MSAAGGHCFDLILNESNMTVPNLLLGNTVLGSVSVRSFVQVSLLFHRNFL